MRRLTPYIKLNSILTSLVIDTCIGVLISILIFSIPRDDIIHTLMTFTNFSDRLKFTVEWMMGFPYGFKPNKDLDNFLGGCMISLLDGWKSMSRIMIEAFG